MLKKIFKRIVKFVEIFLVCPAGKAEIPFDSGCQRASGNIGRSDEDLIMVFEVKNVGFCMERPVRLIVKTKVDPIPQFLPKKIKGILGEIYSGILTKNWKESDFAEYI